MYCLSVSLSVLVCACVDCSLLPNVCVCVKFTHVVEVFHIVPFPYSRQFWPFFHWCILQIWDYFTSLTMLCVTIDSNYKRLFCNGYLPPTESYKKYQTPHILLVRWLTDLIIFAKFFFLRLLMILFTRYQIMLKCWEQNPTDRPTFAKLKETMKEMERNHKVFVTCHISSVNCCVREKINVFYLRRRQHDYYRTMAIWKYVTTPLKNVLSGVLFRVQTELNYD